MDSYICNLIELIKLVLPQKNRPKIKFQPIIYDGNCFLWMTHKPAFY